MTPHPRLLAVVLDRPERGAAWREKIVRDLSEWGIHFEAAEATDSDGFRMVRVLEDQHLYGVARLLDVRETARCHPAQAFLQYRSPCPFLAGYEPVGLVEWCEIEASHRRDWLIPLMKESKGLSVSPESGTARPAIIERSFSLDNLCSKYGFEDGDCMLTRDMDELDGYRSRTAQALSESLAARGIRVHVWSPETAHNMFRIGSELVEIDGRITRSDPASVERLLAGLRTAIWAYDFSLVHDASLFR